MAHFFRLQFRRMTYKDLLSKNYIHFYLIAIILGCIIPLSVYKNLKVEKLNLLLGDRVLLKSNWLGLAKVNKQIPILVMAGHSDSQGIAGAGTAGSAVDIYGSKPMDPNISDELFWNLKVRDAIIRIGKRSGLNIISYDSGVRNIIDPNDPRTNWSVGALHAQNGGYPLEIHFDSYGEYGFGSGLIPALTRELNTLDESLAREFGRYPLFFRGGLGGPRRGIRILEIGKLDGKLEERLRDPKSRKETINLIANKIVRAIKTGITLSNH